MNNENRVVDGLNVRHPLYAILNVVRQAEIADAKMASKFASDSVRAEAALQLEAALRQTKSEAARAIEQLRRGDYSPLSD